MRAGGGRGALFDYVGDCEKYGCSTAAAATGRLLRRESFVRMGLDKYTECPASCECVYIE